MFDTTIPCNTHTALVEAEKVQLLVDLTVLAVKLTGMPANLIETSVECSSRAHPNRHSRDANAVGFNSRNQTLSFRIHVSNVGATSVQTVAFELADALAGQRFHIKAGDVVLTHETVYQIQVDDLVIPIESISGGAGDNVTSGPPTALTTASPRSPSSCQNLFPVKLCETITDVCQSAMVGNCQRHCGCPTFEDVVRWTSSSSTAAPEMTDDDRETSQRGETRAKDMGSVPPVPVDPSSAGSAGSSEEGGQYWLIAVIVGSLCVLLLAVMMSVQVQRCKRWNTSPQGQMLQVGAVNHDFAVIDQYGKTVMRSPGFAASPTAEPIALAWDNTGSNLPAGSQSEHQPSEFAPWHTVTPDSAKLRFTHESLTVAGNDDRVDDNASESHSHASSVPTQQLLNDYTQERSATFASAAAALGYGTSIQSEQSFGQGIYNQASAFNGANPLYEDATTASERSGEDYPTYSRAYPYPSAALNGAARNDPTYSLASSLQSRSSSGRSHRLAEHTTSHTSHTSHVSKRPALEITIEELPAPASEGINASEHQAEFAMSTPVRQFGAPSPSPSPLQSPLAHAEGADDPDAETCSLGAGSEAASFAAMLDAGLDFGYRDLLPALSLAADENEGGQAAPSTPEAVGAMACDDDEMWVEQPVWGNNAAAAAKQTAQRPPPNHNLAIHTASDQGDGFTTALADLTLALQGSSAPEPQAAALSQHQVNIDRSVRPSSQRHTGPQRGSRHGPNMFDFIDRGYSWGH